MKPPKGLNAAGLDARNHAVDACMDQLVPVERFTEAIDRFALAVDMAHRIQAEWVKRKLPILTKGGTTGNVVVAHPLVAMLAESERNAARFGGYLGLDPRSAKQLGALRGRPQERVPMRKQGEPPKVVPLRRDLHK